MAVRRVLQATEPRGEAILRRKSHKVKTFDESLRRLTDDMIETMHRYNGVGLAAPQVGELLQVIVAELPPEDDPETGEPAPGFQVVMCNPEILWQSEAQQSGQEGCLSLANWYGEVPRSEAVEVRYDDLRGKRHRMQAEGYLARILQHEIDHLEGVLFTDRIENLATLAHLTEDGSEVVALDEIPLPR